VLGMVKLYYYIKGIIIKIVLFFSYYKTLTEEEEKYLSIMMRVRIVFKSLPEECYGYVSSDSPYEIVLNNKNHETFMEELRSAAHELTHVFQMKSLFTSVNVFMRAYVSQDVLVGYKENIFEKHANFQANKLIQLFRKKQSA